MYAVTLALHSILRWIVLLVGVLLVGRAAASLATGHTWTARDDRLARAFIIALDGQLLVGLLLYLWASPITTGAVHDLAAAMGNSVTRFWVVEHPLLMVGAIALAHLGLVGVRRAGTPTARSRRAAIFFGLALLLLLVGIPWPFTRVPRPLWPGG